ncbi:MAG: hypothetical protein ACLUBK_03865 [Oliverpabstia sp.]
MTVKVTFVLKNGTEINRMQTKTLNSPDKFEKQLKSEILAAMKDHASIYSFGNLLIRGSEIASASIRIEK